MRTFLLILMLCSSVSLKAQQQKPDRSEPQPQARQEHKTSPDDVQALREDLARMKALVQQMETNLAFVDTTQSPLKHQFQLEIEAWQALIAEMERRLAAAH
ncbi:MAG TPA: hypothetical protein VJN64_14855 [Terriglobales bacterium]|nr:hypothetical protein [Terriglobales bacterium]